MQNHVDHPDPGASSAEFQPPTFWKSSAGRYLLVALVLAALLLGYEYRGYILASDWLIGLPLLICLGMHFFMHGGHGSGGSKS